MKSFINARSRAKAEAGAVAASWKPDADCHASCCAPALPPPPSTLGCCCNVSMQRRNASLCAWNYASNFNPWQQATSKCARHEILALGFLSPPSFYLPLPRPSLSLSVPPLSLPRVVTHLSATCFTHKWRDFVGATFACSLQVGKGREREREKGAGIGLSGRRGTHLTPRGRGPIKLSHEGSRSCAAECAQSINYSPISMATRRTHHSSLYSQTRINMECVNHMSVSMSMSTSMSV